MNLSLPPQIRELIEQRVRSGKYRSIEDVVAAAVSTLEQQEQAGEFAPGELEALIEDGEGSGEALDGEQVFRELHELRQRGQSKAG